MNDYFISSFFEMRIDCEQNYKLTFYLKHAHHFSQLKFENEGDQ